jgi:hypothetical protein
MKKPMEVSGVGGDALEQARSFLEHKGFWELSEDERVLIGDGTFAAGWKQTVFFDGGHTHTVAVMIPEGFPYFGPRFAVLDAPPLLSWPHLEDGKLLCVFPPDTSVCPERPVDQVEGLLHEGLRLLQEILDGKLTSDFSEEFDAYWRRGANRDARKVLSLLEPGGDHREVWLWRGANIYVVAETEHSLQAWLGNRFGQDKTKDKTIVKTLCLRARTAVTPSEYPHKGTDVAKLFSDDPDALNLIAKQAVSDGFRDALIAFPTPNGTALAAVSLATSSKAPPGKRAADPLEKGFRKGRVPARIALLRATSATSKVTRHVVERVDHGWVHGRDHDPKQATLREANVLIIGCGSLGSSVAELLARAGVGRITVMDGELLDWPNISRHALGARDVGNYKASALCSRLTAAFPHLGEICSIDEHLTISNAEALEGRDLVITTTGTWAVDSMVNASQRQGTPANALYAWLEPHLAAAHAVTISKTGGCLRCHMSGCGEHLMPVSEWPEGKAVFLTCGGAFTPYGATELSFAHAMVAEQALEALSSPIVENSHAVWIGRTSRWQGLGGTVSGPWSEEVGDPGEGGKLVFRTWPSKPECPVCSGEG